MSWTAETLVANITAANAALAAAGRGDSNFVVPIWTGGALPTKASFHHIANDPAFRAICAAIPGVIVRDYPGLTVGMDATAVAAGGRWGGNAPLLQGQVTPGLYRDPAGGALWWVIQAFDRAVFTAALSTYPALVRQARVPGEVTPWVQPIDAFNAYKLANPFTGLPDVVLHLGQTWRVTQGDGSGSNVWEPGVFGWELVA